MVTLLYPLLFFIFQENDSKFIINNSIKLEKLVFLKVVSLVIKSGMNILGVETPEEM